MSIVSIGYSALSSSLMVTGEANFRVREDVRITGIKVINTETANGGYETYPAEYYKDGTKVMVTLPKTDSKVTYEVEIKNTSEDSYQLKEINDAIKSNEQMKYEIEGLYLENIIEPNETKTFQIVVSYKDGTSEVPSENTVTFETRYVFEVFIPVPTATNFAEYLKSIANPDTITTYADENGNQQEMYTFFHEKTEQTGELTDYRFIGDNPNNYVYFNCRDDSNVETCEKWRIIGVFPVEDSSGKIEDRVKIIRDDSLEEKMAWDSIGKNNWETASLNEYLNGYYLKKLSLTSRAIIGDTKYYLGGSSTSENLGGPDYYKFERGNTTYGSNPKYWVGKIALMYPSDYVYTYALGVDNTCYDDGYHCSKGNPSSGWLSGRKTQWTLGHVSSRPLSFYVLAAGYVDFDYGGYGAPKIANCVLPALYLASSVSIIDGDGNSENPYRLKLPTRTEAFKATANDQSVTNYEDGMKEEMFTFKHDSTEQTAALTDYRYIGNTPNNYVYFNCADDSKVETCETWRIIGIFSVDDGTGNIEERMKIIKDTSIGNEKWDRWDNGYDNNWKTATLNIYLNETYVKSLSETAQAMIGNTKYYLGGGTSSSINGEKFYQFERGTTVYDTSRPTYWVGKIALMYPSDYVYTYALGVNDKCYTDAHSCSSGNSSSGWLYNRADQWTLAPNSGSASTAAFVHSDGYVYYNFTVDNDFEVRPTLYLASNVSIVDGDGSSGNPYQLAI